MNLDDENAKTITLKDGRNLGWTEYGLPTGTPIICLHGAPGSRIDFERSDAAAKRVGARLISIDRPGIGLSSPDPKGSLLSVARDIQELTEGLKLTAYAVLGGSAGGPYALACAYVLPSSLKAVAVICGLSRTTWSYEGIGWMKWLVFKAVPYLPESAFRWWWSREPGFRVELSVDEHFEVLRECARKAGPHEREVGLFDTDESVRLWLKTSREAFKNGLNGIVADTNRLVADWGFDVEDIRKDLPVRLWYGEYDGLAPPEVGRYIEQRLGNARLRVVNETHGSMFANQTEAYLEELVRLVRTGSVS